jgi:aldose 1-epimerase
MENSNTELKTTLKKEDFEGKIAGKDAKFFVLQNKNGIEITFSNYGQRLLSLMTPDKDGKFEDIVLGFETLNRYTEAKEKYFGAFIGRYANRIADGKYSINGKEYKLATNNGANHLHGGNIGFNAIFWQARQLEKNQIEFFGTSPDMEEGYPGNLNVKVNYLLNDRNELIIRYYATTDKPTFVNLTHHSFFNLAGEGNGSINDHLLFIAADKYTPINKSMIPTGELASVVATPFDFRKPKPIGNDLETEDLQLDYGNGYDHNFVLMDNLTKNNDGLVLAAKVVEPVSGRVLEVLTNEPGIQFYGGNFLDGKTIGKSGKPYSYRGAFCLETQHFPDSPNQPRFPTTLLTPGEQYTSVCMYRFTTVKANE